MMERDRGGSLPQGFLDFFSVARYQPAAMTVIEPDIPAPAGTGEPLTDEDKVLVVFSYLGPLAIVAFLAARREYVRWHARQGLVFFLVAFGVILVMSML
ncbi:MAG: hypothetical protein O7C74_04270, partial [Acidobacteria bacterium]|nr:hypothetical protein [Acidobacteriota bacterium]